MGLHTLVIFITGAATLALEVLASRVLTPYFGVSLYIWTGILSVTLTFLAVGYFLGGRLARRLQGSPLSAAFFGAPAASAVVITLACLVYPWLFPALAQMDLALGSVLAATLLLALPLIVLSAMNPVLVALGREAARPGNPGGRVGDGGAGRIFFISTIGSVAGVLATAFLLIPNLTNFRGLLLLAVVLALCAGLGAWRAGLTARDRRHVAAAGGVGLLAAVALFALAPAYLGKDRAILSAGLTYRIVGEYSSVFGNLKVVDVAQVEKPDNYIRLFLNDGLVQNRLLPEGISFSEYTYALDILSAAFVPQARRALVLGLGAGATPRMLAARGIAVEVVEINPDMVAATAAHVPGALKPDGGLGFPVHLQDARNFVKSCDRAFDIVVIDLFHGDGTPDYLQTADFFADLRRCLAPGGVAVMNSFLAVAEEAAYGHLLATIRAVFPNLVRFSHPITPQDVELNSYLVAFDAAELPTSMDIDSVLPIYRDSMAATLRNGKRVREADVEGALVATDEYNVQSVLNARSFMIYRAAVVGQLPPQILVN